MKIKEKFIVNIVTVKYDQKLFSQYQQLSNELKMEKDLISEKEYWSRWRQLEELRERLRGSIKSSKQIAREIRESGKLVIVKGKIKEPKLLNHISIHNFITLCEKDFGTSKNFILDFNGKIEDVTCRSCLDIYNHCYKDDNNIHEIDNIVDLRCEVCAGYIKFRRDLYIRDNFNLCRKCCKELLGEKYEEDRLKRWKELCYWAIEKLKEKDLSRTKNEFKLQFIPNVIEQFNEKGALSIKQYLIIVDMLSGNSWTFIKNKERELNWCPYTNAIK
jgi:hypothetical protein